MQKQIVNTHKLIETPLKPYGSPSWPPRVLVIIMSFAVTESWVKAALHIAKRCRFCENRFIVVQRKHRCVFAFHSLMRLWGLSRLILVDWGTTICWSKANVMFVNHMFERVISITQVSLWCDGAWNVILHYWPLWGERWFPITEGQLW